MRVLVPIRPRARGVVAAFLLLPGAAAPAEEGAPPRAARSVHLWYEAPESVLFYNEVNRTPTLSIDAGVEGGRFALATGGGTRNTTPLDSVLSLPPPGLDLPEE
jgi:hypothetical protein